MNIEKAPLLAKNAGKPVLSGVEGWGTLVFLFLGLIR
jgi:hypothetical protein